MSQNRFIALLVILSIVAILVASNWSVVLPLSFLGIQTLSLPIGIWLVLAFATGLTITFLLQSIKLLGAGKIDRASDRSPRKSPRPPDRPQERRTTTSQSDRQNTRPTEDEEDDWDVAPPPKSEDWDFDEEEEPQDRDRPRSYSEPDYEAKQEPTSKNVSGSVYSYSYRQPQDTGVGQSEAVRDANYRVIRPPAREPVENTVDEDDWGFDFDDDERR